MASEAQIDATCDRLRRSRHEIFAMAHVLKGDRPPEDTPQGFPRSRIMRALTGEPGRRVLGSAALALAMSRPKMVWRLAGLAPLLRPVLMRFLMERLFRSRRPESTKLS
jgi:hypothetical protein